MRSAPFGFGSCGDLKPQFSFARSPPGAGKAFSRAEKSKKMLISEILDVYGIRESGAMPRRNGGLLRQLHKRISPIPQIPGQVPKEIGSVFLSAKAAYWS
jgi:hypothetical protein